jgi:hypothetical protein
MSAIPLESQDLFLATLLNTPDITDLYNLLSNLAIQNEKLKQELLLEKTKNLNLEQTISLNASQTTLFHISLEQETNTIKEELYNEYQGSIDSLQSQVDTLQSQLETAHNAIQKLSSDNRLQHTAHDQHKNALLMRSNQLYVQLAKYQRGDSLRIAKNQLETDSRAYLTLDKLGSTFHLDTIQGSKALANVTQNTQALATKGETSEVLCTRDQVRLTINGKLFDLKSLGDIRWYRSSGGSSFSQIPNAGGRARADATVDETYGVAMTYIPTVDDINCTIRCQFVDPTSGATLVAEIGPVVPDKELLETAVECFKKNELDTIVGVSESDVDMLLEKEKEHEKIIKSKDSLRTSNIFTQKPNFLESLGMGGGGGVMNDYKLTLSTKKIIFSGKKNGKKVQIKIATDSSVYISAHSDTETGFSLYLFGNWVNCNAPSRHDRDVIIALTRLFIQQTRINDVNSDSERHREKQYSSAWMLSLTNYDTDIITMMPKSKIQQSQPLAIIADELNVGEMVLETKLVDCGYAENDVFLDVLRTNFENAMDLIQNDDETNPEEQNDDKKNICLWVTRQEFEHSALLQTQIATVDFDPNRYKPIMQSIPQHRITSASSIEMSLNRLQSTSNIDESPDSAQNPSQKPQRAQINHHDEYVPYDIDDVTPQLGQGKRGFDDIIIGGDSDDESNDGQSRRPRGSLNNGNQGEHDGHHGAPAFEVKIKKADEVQVDSAANSAKIRMILKNNNTLSLTSPQQVENHNSGAVTPHGANTAVSSGMATMGRGRRTIQTSKTMNIDVDRDNSITPGVNTPQVGAKSVTDDDGQHGEDHKGSSGEDKNVE